ncbi:MAG: DNA repair protein RecN [Trueperaceae bacterium]
MLRALELRDFVLVDAVRIEPGPGLNAFSGETGTGKSLLVDALQLLAGGRADASLVRHGAERALVQAEFASGPTSASRTLAAEGRHHARLDGELVTVAELADATGGRIAVFAQHAHQALLSARAQREALDRLLLDEAADALRAYRTAFAERRRDVGRLEALRASTRERNRRRDLATVQIEEIDAAELRANEEDALATEADRLRHADRISSGVAASLASLDDDEAALTALSAARRELAGAARFDPHLGALARDLREATQGAQAVADELRRFLDDFDADPARLDATERRLTSLQRLFAKYGDGSTEVLDFRARLAAERDALQHDDDAIAELEARIEQLDADLRTHAAVVRDGRRRAGDALALDVTPLLERLALSGARLTVRLDPVEPGPHGTERVAFDLAANPGEPGAPLTQAASGGELSRVMLALWLVTGSDRGTLVFDEVDAGVGGRAAVAVGELLAELGQRHQVLVVTHLAQVAAFADRQFRVGKRSEDGRTVSTVVRIDGAEREQELARMLAGHDGETAVRAARDLLQRASRDRADGVLEPTTKPPSVG